jgi:hypothetical protein
MKAGVLLIRRLLPTSFGSTVAMGKKKGKNYYAVRVGRIPGIYQSWPDCEQQVRTFSLVAFVAGNVVLPR